MGKGTALLRQQNEKRTLALLRTIKHSSRQEIAKTLGLSKNTISLIVEKFINHGIVKEMGVDDQGGVGRPRIQLCLVANAYKTIGIFVQNSYCQYVVTDYYSNILENGVLPIQARNSDSCVDELILLSKQLVDKHPEVIGVGIAIPALVDPVRGIVHSSSHLNWRGIHLKERMDKQLPVETIVLNSVKASALAPSSVIPRSNFSNLFYISIDEGVGGAQIMDSQIYNGASWTAGEVGHICVQMDGPLCTCGQRGCLESLVSVPAIKERIQNKYPSKQMDENFLKVLTESKDDPFIEEILRQSGEYVGFALSQIVNLLNPQYIIIDSPFEKLEIFKSAVKLSMECRALKVPLEKTNLQFIKSYFSSAVGGAFAVILDFEKE